MRENMWHTGAEKQRHKIVTCGMILEIMLSENISHKKLIIYQMSKPGISIDLKNSHSSWTAEYYFIQFLECEKSPWKTQRFNICWASVWYIIYDAPLPGIQEHATAPCHVCILTVHVIQVSFRNSLLCLCSFKILCQLVTQHPMVSPENIKIVSII